MWLSALVAELLQKKMKLDVDLNLIKKLDEVYISTRYPSDLGLLPVGKPSIQDATELYDFANMIYRNVRKIFSETDITPEKPNNSK